LSKPSSKEFIVMQRFFLPALLPKVDEVVSLAPIHNQLRRVLRVQPGTQLVVLDNEGSERLMEVVGVERRDTTARVVEVRPAPAEPTVAITLYQCVLKSDKFELILQKATELGVTTLVPVISHRTVARPGKALENKQTRWETIVREAAEQSERGALPVVAPTCSFFEAVASATGTRLLPWEESEASPGLLAALGQSQQPIESVSMMIGPEGGFEAGEIQEAIDAGWQVVTLGKRILRAETAALATMSVLMAALGELGDAPMVKLSTTHKRSKTSPKRESNHKEESAAEAVTVEIMPTEVTPTENAPVQDAQVLAVKAENIQKGKRGQKAESKK
jgi:16S rRNA (uracil1498-N3)-methyltransferase